MLRDLDISGLPPKEVQENPRVCWVDLVRCVGKGQEWSWTEAGNECLGSGQKQMKG